MGQHAGLNMGQTAGLNMGQPAGLSIGQAVGNTESLKAVLNTCWQRLWPLRQDTTKAFLCRSCITSRVLQSLGDVAKADHRLVDQFISHYQVAGHCLLWGILTCGQYKSNHPQLRIKKLMFLSPSWSTIGCCGIDLKKNKVTKDHLCPAVLCQDSEAAFKNNT